jgi:predicted permease
MNGLLLDLRHAWRQICRTPRSSALIVIMLALGAAVQTTSLAIVDRVDARYLPSAPLRHVFALGFLNGGTAPIPAIRMTTLRRLEAVPPPAMAAAAGVGFHEPAILIAAGRATTVLAEPVTGGFARTFDLHAQAGRWLAADDDRPTAPPAVVISDRLWREWFHAEANLAGTTIVRVWGQPSLIVGVAEPGFRGVHAGFETADLWIADSVWSTPAFHPIWPAAIRDDHALTPFVRLRSDHAAAELAAQLDASVAVSTTRVAGRPAGAVLTSASTALSAPFQWFRTIVYALGGLVFLAVCANLTNLFYARSAARTAEFGVRVSLGAGTGRLVRLIAVETTMIGIMAGCGATAITAAVIGAVSHAFPVIDLDHNRVTGLTLTHDPWQPLFAVVAAGGAALAIGALVSVRAARRSPQLWSMALPSGGAAPHDSLRTGLVALQVTAALVLVMGAGLFLENPPADLDLDRRVRFDTSRLTAAGLDLSMHGFQEGEGRSFFRRLLVEVQGIPHVEAAALATGIPGGGAQARPSETPLIAEDSPTHPTGNPRRIRASIAAVSPGFLSALGLAVRAGRDFRSWDDLSGQPVAIVSDSTAVALYPHGGALGRTVQLGFGGRWAAIVGVFPDPVEGASDAGVFARPSNVILVPLEQRYSPKLYVLARTDVKRDISIVLLAAVAQSDSRVALFQPETVEDGFMAWIAPVRAANRLLMTLGGLALLIALVGIYSLLDLVVSHRTREFGIRMALGSTPNALVRLVLQQATRTVLIGLLAGVFVATVASRLIESAVVRVMPNQIATWAIVPILVLLTGVAAAYVPARRAAAVDPNVALRHD